MGHETYNALRHFADSWGLLAMFVFFVGVIVWALRPGSRKKHADAANAEHITFHRQCAALVGDEHIKLRRLKLRPNQLRLPRIERPKYCLELHDY